MSDEIEQVESEQNVGNVKEVTDTKDFHRHHPRKVLYNYLALGVFILLILLFVGSRMEYLRPFVNMAGTEEPSQVKPQQNVQVLDIISELPPFPEELNWVEVEGFDNYHDVIYMTKNSYGHVETSGRLYQATSSVMSLGEKSYQYEYMDKLRNFYGWSQYLKIDSVEYEGQSAGGPLGDLWGLIKQDNERIFTVIFTEHLSNSCLPSGEPEDIVFPCEKTYEIFISDPFDLVQPETDWKTYRNEEYGFEFEYPSDWILEEEHTEVSGDSLLVSKITDVSLYTPEAWTEIENGSLNTPASMSVKLDRWVKGFNVLEYSKQVNDGWYQNYETVTYGSVNEFDTIHYSDRDANFQHHPIDTVFLDDREGNLLVTMIAEFEVPEDVLTNIINSVRIEAVCVTDTVYKVGECDCPSGTLASVSEREGTEIITCVEAFKTYRNEEYGFEFEYPKDYEATRLQGEFMSLSNLYVPTKDGQSDISFQFYLEEGDGGENRAQTLVQWYFTEVTINLSELVGEHAIVVIEGSTSNDVLPEHQERGVMIIPLNNHVLEIYYPASRKELAYTVVESLSIFDE